jgi:hydrogenase maturation protease
VSDSTRVVALGQAAAGDDGAALLVLEQVCQLARTTPDSNVEFISAATPSRVVELLCHRGPVWILDAVVGAGTPGRILELTPEMLADEAPCSVSSHGMDVKQAIALCETLYPERLSPEIRILAISIDAPSCYGEGLSTVVAQAVERCARELQSQLFGQGQQANGLTHPEES